jgi:xanthine dehydrogenase YagT iron-sulfur-binding subunit
MSLPAISKQGALAQVGSAQQPDFSRSAAMMLRINGETRKVEFDTRLSVLDLLREQLNLPGTKKGCNQGACGACTVLLDGQRVLACLTLAVQCDGRDLTTVEGLSSAEVLHPLQQAFIEHDGFQCGYCTPGQLCSALGMIEEFRRGVPSRITDDLIGDGAELCADEIRERMSGNLCRCGAYNGIVTAITETFARETRS